MKHLLTFLVCIFMSSVANAENWVKFSASAVEQVINTRVAATHRQAAADEYEKNMDATTGKISVTGLYKVCIAGGMDIQTNDGYNACRAFLNDIIAASNFGTNSATQQTCATLFNGVWSLSSDGKQYQCVGRDGHKLVYKKSCDGQGGNCIKQFSNLQTQGAAGREFISAYAKKHNLNLTCHAKIDTRRTITSPLGQDYIMCSAGGKSYEFEFDDLNQDPGDKSSRSENTAMCELYGGKIVNTGDSIIEQTWASCDIARDVCNNQIHTLAIATGHTTMYQGYCRLSREVKSVATVFLKTIDGIDNRVFYNSGAQMRIDDAKVMVEEYLRKQFPNESYIVCDANIQELNNPASLDPDYVMTCTVGSKQVDFLFQDLTEGNKVRAAAGMEAMQCIINGGTFKGETCRGPTKAECIQLDAALRARGDTAGAYYDDDARACIMGNAMKAYKRDVATGYIVGAVVIVGGTLFVIGTGGATAPAVVGGAEMLLTDLAINKVIDLNHKRLMNGAASRFNNFIEDAYNCNSEDCALNVLQKHYATLSGVITDLNTEDQATIDATMDRLIGLIGTEFVACGTDDNGNTVYTNQADCVKHMSTLRLIDYIDKVSEPVLIVGSIIYNPGYVTSRFMKIKRISKMMSKIDDANTFKRTYTTVKIPDYKEKINPNIISNPEVRSIYLSAADAEPRITQDLVNATQDMTGEMHGLEYRLKTPESTLGKIARDRVDNNIPLEISDADIAGSFKDIVRYTFASTPEDLVSETQKLVSRLEQQGYKQIGPAKNTFLDTSNPVDMINIRMQSPTGQIFELQANTPRNLQIKDIDMHPDYEAWRVIKDKSSPEAQTLMERMLEMGKNFEIPKNIESFQ